MTLVNALWTITSVTSMNNCCKCCKKYCSFFMLANVLSNVNKWDCMIKCYQIVVVVCVCVGVCVCCHTGRVMRQCSSIGAVVLVVSNMYDVCWSCLSLSAFSCCHRIALCFSRAKRGAECVSLLSRYIASPLPRSLTRLLVAHMVTGPLRFQAKLYGISEQRWAPETWHAGPLVSGNALMPVHHRPSYG